MDVWSSKQSSHSRQEIQQKQVYRGVNEHGIIKGQKGSLTN